VEKLSFDYTRIHSGRSRYIISSFKRFLHTERNALRVETGDTEAD